MPIVVIIIQLNRPAEQNSISAGKSMGNLKYGQGSLNNALFKVSVMDFKAIETETVSG